MSLSFSEVTYTRSRDKSTLEGEAVVAIADVVLLLPVQKSTSNVHSRPFTEDTNRKVNWTLYFLLLLPIGLISSSTNKISVKNVQ